MDQTSTMHSVNTGFIHAVLSCHFPSNIKYSVLILYVRSCQPVTDQQLHFLLCNRKEPYHTRGHTWTSPHLFPTKTRTFASATFIVNITHQHDKDRTLQGIYSRHLLLYMLFSGTYGNYLRAAWNRAKSHMRLSSHGLITPVLCHRQWRREAKCRPGPTKKVPSFSPLKFAYKNLKWKKVVFRTYLKT